MARDKPDTERVAMYLTTEAIDLLTQLAPSPKKRGQYVSNLIKRAAQEAGLIAAPGPPSLADRIAALERELGALKSEVAGR
jgi:hypothetical protein